MAGLDAAVPCLQRLLHLQPHVLLAVTTLICQDGAVGEVLPGVGKCKKCEEGVIGTARSWTFVTSGQGAVNGD